MKSIHEHEGNKYLRSIYSAEPEGKAIKVDVYSVIEAFKVTCPGRQQALKKILCAGERGKGTTIDDLMGALAAISRAIELQKQREQEPTQRDVFDTVNQPRKETGS